MVIQCPECQARFKMADEKAKNGVKVRCSRCQNVFPVEVPATVSEPLVTPVMAAAAPEVPPTETEKSAGFAETTAPASAPVEDAGSRPEADSFAFDHQPEQTTTSSVAPGMGDFDLADFSVDTETPKAGSASVASGADELDLGDFNLDAPPQFADEDVASTNDFPLDENDPVTEFSFAAAEESDFADESGPVATNDFSFDADASDSDFSFETGATAADFSFDEEPPTFGESESDSPEEDSISKFSLPATGDEFSFGDLSADSAFAIDPPQSAATEDASEVSVWSSGNGPNDEVDFASDAETSGADEFDFSNLSFGDETPPSSLPPISPALSAVSPPMPSAPLPMHDSFEQRPPAPEKLEPTFSPPQKPAKKALSVALVFVIVLLLLGGAAGYFFWQEGTAGVSSLLARITGDTPPQTAAGQVRIADLDGYFVENVEAGQLFVIQGQVVNEYTEARSAIAVKGILFSKAGQPLLQQTVFSGNRLEENALRTRPFAKIEESMNNQFGDSLSNLNIAPGKSLPFTIVFRNLPVGIAEFTAEVTDSKPGAG